MMINPIHTRREWVKTIISLLIHHHKAVKSHDNKCHALKIERNMENNPKICLIGVEYPSVTL